MTTICPRDARDYIRSKTSLEPEVGIVLGSGLGGIAESVEVTTAFDFPEIPGFQRTFAQGHQGRLLIGHLEETPVALMAGRYHRYEGYSTREITFPTEVMSQLGIKQLIISNAAGGVNPQLQVGDFLIIRDHINWLGSVPSPSSRSQAGLRGPETVSRKLNLYPSNLVDLVLSIARSHHINAYPGTYLGTKGPCYETRSEYRMMKKLGADVVGMSSIPEALTAASLGIATVGISMVSNVATPDQQSVASHQEVLEAGRSAEANLERLIRGILNTKV